MKSRQSQNCRLVTLDPPKVKGERHPLTAFYAPDLYENGKRRRGRSILDYAKSLQKSGKR